MQFFLHYLSESTMLYIVDDDKCQLFPQKIESSGYVNQAKDAWVERDEKKKREKVVKGHTILFAPNPLLLHGRVISSRRETGQLANYLGPRYLDGIHFCA